MEPHAGYAAVVAVGQRTMQDFLRVLFAANKVPRTFNLSGALPASAGMASVSARLVLDVPRLTLAAANGGNLVLDVRAWGPVTISFPNAPQFQQQVLFTATVLVAPSLSIAGNNLNIGLNAPSAALQSFNVSALGGSSSVQQLIQTILSNNNAFQVVQNAVRQQLAIQPAALPLDFLGGLLPAPQKTVTARVLDEALVLGIDVGWVNPSPIPGTGLVLVYVVTPVASQGNPDALSDFRQSRDFAYWIHPDQLPMMFLQIYLEARSIIEQQGATLDRLIVRPREGALRVRGKASRAEGSVTFGFDALPDLTANRFPWLEVLRFHTANVSVDVDVAGWLQFAQVLAGIFTVGAAALGIDRLIDALRSGITRTLGSQGATLAQRNQEITLPNTTKPPIGFRVERYEVHRAGLFSALSVTPRIPKARITGVHRSIPAAGGSVLQLLFSVTLPPDVSKTDPQLRVRWSVRPKDTNRPIHVANGPAETNSTLRAEIPLPADQEAAELSLSCHVYRSFGPAIESLHFGSVALTLDDPLDSRHPFVRWRHTVPVPFVQVEADGSTTKLGEPLVERFSKIHRTDLPGRCLFAHQYSSLAEPEYLDDLPFPRSDLVRLRARVCDYCFFGGPDKNTPLI